ncbi:hypothetical protein PCI56_04060 [Plesiomonas shigelloides subsp. oncorhynchi]|nr:hypothetical protein [Plesiomonas shigelloides]
MDEAWKWVNDDAFSEFVKNKQLTIRKQNGFGVFGTQMPKSLLDSRQGAELKTQSPAGVYLPNKNATREEYVDQLGLTDCEFDLFKELDEGSRMCLIKQGGQSVLCSLDMPGMDDVLSILSAGTDELPLFDEAVNEVGSDPDAWIPVYQEKVRVAKPSESTERGYAKSGAGRTK